MTNATNALDRLREAGMRVSNRKTTRVIEKRAEEDFSIKITSFSDGDLKIFITGLEDNYGGNIDAAIALQEALRLVESVIEDHSPF